MQSNGSLLCDPIRFISYLTDLMIQMKIAIYLQYNIYLYIYKCVCITVIRIALSFSFSFSLCFSIAKFLSLTHMDSKTYDSLTYLLTELTNEHRMNDIIIFKEHFNKQETRPGATILSLLYLVPLGQRNA